RRASPMRRSSPDPARGSTASARPATAASGTAHRRARTRPRPSAPCAWRRQRTRGCRQRPARTGSVPCGALAGESKAIGMKVPSWSCSMIGIGCGGTRDRAVARRPLVGELLRAALLAPRGARVMSLVERVEGLDPLALVRPLGPGVVDVALGLRDDIGLLRDRTLELCEERLVVAQARQIDPLARRLGQARLVLGAVRDEHREALARFVALARERAEALRLRVALLLGELLQSVPWRCAAHCSVPGWASSASSSRWASG